ncbi:hypothetical protein [Saccharicrinis sp. FJH54]|uniref:hypothetical protein n=1 Tax=Saccharicrinis sp. FJH54 TaxID=3344665 RepID=UPI0035D3FA71
MSKKDPASGKKSLLLSNGGYYRNYISDISVCGYEKILVLGYEAEKLVRYLHKKCLSGKITVSGLSEEVSKAVAKKYVLKNRIEVTRQSLTDMVKDSRTFDIIIMHLYHNDPDVEPDLRNLKQILGHTGTIFMREKSLNFDSEDMVNALDSTALSLLKQNETTTNIFGNVYDLKIRHK